MITGQTTSHWDRSFTFDDPFLAKIASSATMGRLKDIGFLGAVDYCQFSQGVERRGRYYNRYEHSIGVAKLALLYANIRELSEKERRILASAGLLHDIGHCPLSHTLEPIFKSNFGVSHHDCGRDILFGRSSFGSEIIGIMAEYEISIEEVVAMIDGYHDGCHAFLFASPINLDTIDGICRAKKFVAVNQDCEDLVPRDCVTSLAESRGGATNQTDEFWLIKGEVYAQIIHSRKGLLFDGLAQAYMDANIDSFEANDFLGTERDLRLAHPRLFEMLECANQSFGGAYGYLKAQMPELLEFTLQAPSREFYVNLEVVAHRPDDLENRYTQSKSYSSITIEDLLTQGLA